MVKGGGGGGGQDHVSRKIKMVLSQVTGNKIGISRFTKKKTSFFFYMNSRNL